MKTLQTLLLAVIVAACFVPAHADSGATRFRVPFGFHVGQETLPAGDYLVSVVAGHTLKIQQLDGNRTVMVSTNFVEGPLANGRAQMVFHRYDNEYFCARVWAPSRSEGRELFVSPRELMLARKIKQEQVVITATK